MSLLGPLPELAGELAAITDVLAVSPHADQPGRTKRLEKLSARPWLGHGAFVRKRQSVFMPLNVFISLNVFIPLNVLYIHPLDPPIRFSQRGLAGCHDEGIEELFNKGLVLFLEGTIHMETGLRIYLAGMTLQVYLAENPFHLDGALDGARDVLKHSLADPAG